MRKLWLHVELFYQTYNMLYGLCFCAFRPPELTAFLVQLCVVLARQLV